MDTELLARLANLAANAEAAGVDSEDPVVAVLRYPNEYEYRVEMGGPHQRLAVLLRYPSDTGLFKDDRARYLLSKASKALPRLLAAQQSATPGLKPDTSADELPLHVLLLEDSPERSPADPDFPAKHAEILAHLRAPDRPPRVVAILAVAQNGALGLRGKIPWRLPADLKFFKDATMGHHILVGRKTLETLPTLRGRTLLVLTRANAYGHVAATTVHTLEEAVSLAKRAGDTTLYVAGGAEVYTSLLPFCDEILVTQVFASPEADTFLDPDLLGDWMVADRLAAGPATADTPAYETLRLARVRTPRPRPDAPALDGATTTGAYQYSSIRVSS